MAWLRGARGAGPLNLGGDGGESEGGDSEGPAVPPEYLGGEFPSPVLVGYNPIDPAPYKFIRPKKFARQFGKFNREEIMKNYDLAKKLAMSELEQELAGLEKFAPAAAALKRQQTSIDNIFNQAQRTRQIESVMPEIPGALQAQGERAETYASGALPDAVQDRALELGIRSRSADMSTAGGFGARSSVARKASDLLSAEQRVQLAQYGEQLLGQNAQLRAQLLLAPTEYSDAGSQIRVMPEVGAGRLTAQALGMFNEATILPVATALSAKIQQKQFKASLIQRTNEFNAANELAVSQANAGIQNQFALDKFGYEVGYAGVVAGVDTANNNTALGLAQQQQYGQIFQDYAQQAQQAQQAGAIASGIGNIIPGVIQGISGLFSPSDTATAGGGGYGPTIEGGASGDIDFGGEGPTVGGETIVAPPDYSGSSGIDYDTATAPQQPDIDVGGDVPPFDASYDYSTEGYSFRAATGVQFQPSYESTGNGILRTAGLSYSPVAMPNAVKAGSDFRGRSVYSNPLLLSGTDTAAGARTAQTLAGVLAPLGALGEEDLAKLNEVGAKSADPELIQALDDFSGRRDTKGFINETLKAYGDTTIEDLAKNPDKNAGALTYASYKIAQNWTTASPEQKGLLLSSLGVRGVKVQDGKTLGQAVIPATNKPGTQPATVAHALDWFRRGINAYPLTQKWDKFSTLAQITAGRTDPESVAQTASKLRMLGAGTSGAEVPNVTAESLQRGGWSPSPHLGVGAIVASRGASMPEGYTQIGQDSTHVIAAPQGTAYSARGAVLKSAVPTQRGGGIPVSPELYNGIQWGVGALNIYNQWSRQPGMGAAVSTAQTVAGAVDRYNQQQGTPSNYGQFVGSAAQLYAAYEAAKRGNYVGAAGYGTAAAFNGMAAWANSQGNAALAAQYTQYAGYAQAGMNFYGAYQAWKQGDKAGAAMLAGGAGAELAGFGGAGLIGAGAYTGYHAWGTGNVAQGALGGSMMLAGTVMAVGGPVGWAVGGALMAASVLGSAFKTGTTNKEHIARDTFRTYLKNSGLAFDQDGTKGSNVMLADGTVYALGMEDDEGRHSVTNPGMLSDEQKAGGKDDRSSDNSLRAYDIDYTNDLDFTSAMAGQTLTRLMAGGVETVTDQMGNALGNAGIANIGYNQAMTKENFDKMAANQRGFYAKAGISNKNDAYQLANMAYAEGRMDEFQHTQAMQSINMIFDENGFDQAQQLMSGRQQGANAAEAQAIAESGAPQPKPPADLTGTAIADTIAAQGPGKPIQPGTIPATSSMGGTAPGVPGMKPISPAEVPNFSDWGPIVPYGGQPAGDGTYFKNSKVKTPGLMLTKEEIQARNRSRYASEAVA